MFIPISDTNPALRKPYITYGLIIINVAMYVLSYVYSFDVFVFSKDLFLAHPIQAFPSLITHQFLHGSWSHLIFNMLFLYIFGDNMEGSLGRKFFLLFYLSCGAGAALIEVYFDPYFGANGPGLLIGASGSISGVLASYALRYPTAKILTWTLFVLFLKIRAAWFIGIWIATQFLFEILTPQGTTAYIAHIGGFVIGLVVYSIYHKYRLSGNS
ncbi:MAG: rhomboid family intramembrane serine protease [FCB group bacterium]|nr:rhomboid family intramembrane serine protease [FCB group bacterium]MBL7028071.1 rhomboid family intramembrane serine protease [Candidatus Neomarinimicrobiota bacterium]MBL7122809.1 rhomboid family intramembrane serine protease [Candidatus Neomarinimicrobiota bacterium]